MKQLYYDYAAATPLDPKVLKAMQPFFSERFYNPSATYLAAKSVNADIAKARQAVASCLGVKASEITFTAGGTEANNLAIHGVMAAFPGKSIVVSSIEHDSVLVPAQQYKSLITDVNNDGLVDLTALKTLLTDEVVLVSIMYANNEIGTIEPLREIGRLLASIRQDRAKRGVKLPVYFHTDACQAAAFLDLHPARLGVDLMTINGGKIYGPKQSGVLYVKTGVQIHPQVLGGGQESGMRSGTENVAQIVGLATALTMVQTNRHEEARQLSQLRDQFIDKIEQDIPGVIINGSHKHRLPNNIHLTIPGQDNERLLMALDEQGIICASGSACSASKEEASHVLRAIGKTDTEAYASLRFTLGRDSNLTDIDHTVKTLASLLV